MSGPPEWRKARLAEVAVVDPETVAGSGEEVIDYISLEDVARGQIAASTRVRLADAPSRARRRIRGGDVLFGTVRPNLQSHAQYKGGLGNPVASTGFAVIRARPETAVPGFLAHWVLGSEVTRQVDRLIAGSNYPAVSSRDVRQLEIRLPDVEVQTAIAAALDDAEDQVAALERLLVKKQGIKRGLTHQLLTGETRLPGFDGDWRSVCLGDHVTYVKTAALSRAELDETSPLRCLHYGDVHKCADAWLDAAAAPMPRAPSALARRAGRLQAGDLVFVDASEDPDGVGKSVEIAGVPQGGVVSGLHTIAARFDKAVLADGFKAYLQFVPSFRGALLRLAAGTKVLATTRSQISSIDLALPRVEEQRAIARVLGDADLEIAALRRRIVKAREMKQGMMQELLAGSTPLLAMEGAKA